MLAALVGPARAGRQLHLVDADDFCIDLLLFHLELVQYFTVELKTGKFAPEHIGQPGCYVAALDDLAGLVRTDAEPFIDRAVDLLALAREHLFSNRV